MLWNSPNLFSFSPPFLEKMGSDESGLFYPFVPPVAVARKDCRTDLSLSQRGQFLFFFTLPKREAARTAVRRVRTSCFSPFFSVSSLRGRLRFSLFPLLPRLYGRRRGMGRRGSWCCSGSFPPSYSRCADRPFHVSFLFPLFFNSNSQSNSIWANIGPSLLFFLFP